MAPTSFGHEFPVAVASFRHQFLVFLAASVCFQQKFLTANFVWILTMFLLLSLHVVLLYLPLLFLLDWILLYLLLLRPKREYLLWKQNRWTIWCTIIFENDNHLNLTHSILCVNLVPYSRSSYSSICSWIQKRKAF